MITGLAARLTFRLVLLVTLIVAGAAYFSLVQIRAALESELAGELERMRNGVEVTLTGMAGELEEDLDRLVADLPSREPELLERLLAGGGGLREAAGQLAGRARLDHLELIDGAGMVLSSTWVERAGLKAGDDTGPTAGSNVRIAVLAGPEEEVPGMVLRRELPVGRRALVLVAGRELGMPLLRRVAGNGVALILRGDARPPLVSDPAVRLDLRNLAAEQPSERGPGGVQRLRDSSGSNWDAQTVLLSGGDGRALATVVVAVKRDGLQSILGRMRRGFIVLGLAAALLAVLAGIGMARGITRPVRELVRAFDAAAAGEADYSLPATRQDELQELIVSVSRLRRALESQQRRSVAAERVATWRDVARHVAHEVKNPLAPIRLTVENLLRARASAPQRFDAMFTEGMGTILEEVEQLRRMVEEFSAFARLPLPTLRPENLERIIDAVLELYAADSGLELQFRPCGEFPAVPLDADQISRALKNVIGNAVQAMRETGETKLPLRVTTFVEEGMACVEVADRGSGFSTESRRRVFEPYFTTRDGGTGLGMALTYRIIIDHGGTITAENRPGGGARVTLRLPLETGASPVSPLQDGKGQESA